MKTYRRYLLFSALALILLSGCDLWDFERVDFPAVFIGTAEPISPTQVKIGALIQGLANDELIDHGHVWSSNGSIPTIDDNDGYTSLGGRTTNGPFTSLAEGLKPNTEYTFRAYILIEGREPGYSEPLSFETGTLQVRTLPEITYDGQELQLFGLITGLSFLNFPEDEVSDFGHLWSTSSSAPTLEGNDYDDLTGNNGSLFQDTLFISTVTSPAQRITIYYRSYAILNGVPVYGNVEAFCLTSWEEQSSGPLAIARATAFVLDNYAFAGTGERVGQRYQDGFSFYDPSFDSWTPIAPFAGGPRSGAVSFTSFGHGYVGLGENNTGTLYDFWLYDLDSDSWLPVADFPGTPRSGAVSFVIDERVFVGAGHDGSDYLHDFWEYDPENDLWSPAPDFPGAPRSGAVSFVVNGKAYVGTGNDGSTYFSDFWEFDPLAGWQELSFAFPGRGRTEAVALSFGDIAVLAQGEGDNNTGPPLGDFWIFDPLFPPYWFEATPFLPEELKFRSRGVSFVIEDTAYIGTGSSTIETGRFFADLWNYRITCD